MLPASGGEPFYRQKFGVIFGETGGATTATITSTALDIELVYSDDIDRTRDRILVEQVPDITGDGLPEYAISNPAYNADDGSFTTDDVQGAVILIRSEALNVASGAVIDLTALSTSEGAVFAPTFRLTGELFRLGQTLHVSPDLDGDGSENLMFTDVDRNIYVIDAIDFLSMNSTAEPNDFYLAGGIQFNPIGAPHFPVFPVSAGDVNGDGVADVMSPAEFGPYLLFYDGATFADELALGGVAGISTGAPIFTVNFADFGSSHTFSDSAPLFIPEADVYAVSFLGDDGGSLVIIERQDVIDALANSGFTEMFLTR